jgi:hypothetical protein
MELKEMLKTEPRNYLKQGFFAPDGQLRPGLNGEYSLAMAYRCREEGLSPDTLKAITDAIGAAVPASARVSEGDPPVEPVVLNALAQVHRRNEVERSPALSGLLSSADPWIKTWRGLSALVVHLQRITAQLALLKAAPPPEGEQPRR